MAKTPRLPIAALFAQKGIRPSRRLGQNFMVDANMLDFLVRQARLEAGDVVLEIGAGTGFLTERLTDAAASVVAVEIDARLCRIAGERLAERPSLVLLNRDALDRDAWDPEVERTVKQALRNNPGAPLKMVSNLPYCVATGVITTVLTGALQFSGCTFTCQKEVADRLTATAGSSDYGYISVIVAVLAELRVVRRLPPTVFWPRPKVESAIVDMTPLAPKPLKSKDIERLAETASALFTARRRQVRAALKALKFDENDIVRVGKVLAGHSLDLTERVFRLPPHVILEIAGGIGG